MNLDGDKIDLDRGPREREHGRRDEAERRCDGTAWIEDGFTVVDEALDGRTGSHDTGDKIVLSTSTG
jgi:hypothetical protein